MATWVIGEGDGLGGEVGERVGQGERAADGDHDLPVTVVGGHEVRYLGQPTIVYTSDCGLSLLILRKGLD